jgi:hypothetical protein
MSHWLFLPNDALRDVETLSRLSLQKLSELREFINSSQFRAKYSTYVKMANLLGIADEDSASLCTFVNYVQNQRLKAKKTGDDVPGEIEHFLIAIQKTDRRDQLLKFVRENRAALASFFSGLPVYEFSSKVRELELGPLPHLKEFRAFCDLRPVYDVEGTQILECFPVITLSLVTHSSENDEKKHVLVQLTEANVAEFTDQFARLERKLTELKAKFSSFLSKKSEE